MPKDYKRIESKKRIRRRAKEFIKRHLSELGGSRNINYFGLLGTSDSELIEITDPLGIPRENIICAEKDRKSLNYIKRQNWGVELYEGDALDFFLNTDRKLDVIHLDYQGTFHGRNIGTIRAVALRQALKPKGILITNFLGRREREKDSYLGPATEFFLDEEKYKEYHSAVREMISNWDFKDDFKVRPGTDFIKSDIPFESFRDYGITTNINLILMNGIEYMPIYLWETLEYDDKLRGLIFANLDKTIYESLPNYSELCKDIRKEIEDNILYLTNLLSENKRAGVKERPLFFNAVSDPYEVKIPVLNDFIVGLESKIASDIISVLHRHLFNLKDMSDKEIMNRYYYAFARLKREFVNFLTQNADPALYPEIAYFLDHAFRLRDRRAYIARYIERYKYLSDANSPMFTDFFLFDQFEEHQKKLDGIFIFDGDGYLYGLDGMMFKEIHNSRDNKIIANTKRLNPEDYPKRKFMGSSFKPKISGKKYYEFLCEAVNAGQSTEDFHEDLLDNYRTTKGQLKAFNIHAMRGTYGSVPLREESEVEEIPFVAEITDIINSENPYKFFNRFPEYIRERIRYFLEEDLPYKIKLNQEEKEELVRNISKSRWFKDILKDELDESQVNTFFDDVMIYTLRKGKVPRTQEIKQIYQNSRKGLKDLSFKRETETKALSEEPKSEGEEMPKGKPYIDKKEAINLLMIGTPVDEILAGYRGVTKGQLSAFKAHITMGTYDNPKDDKPELTRDEAYKLLRRGWTYDQIAEVYSGVNRDQLRAYKAWITMKGRNAV